MKKNEKLFDAINHLDDDLLEQAQTFRPKKKLTIHSKWGALAACLALMVIVGTTAYATGLTNALTAYFLAESNEQVTDAVFTNGPIASNKDMKLRIDGAVADQRTCHVVISFIALNEETRKQFAKGNLSVQDEFSLSAKTTDGKQMDIPNWQSATYTESGSLWKTKSKSMFDDADMTYVISYAFDQSDIRMDDIDKLTFAYHDLVLSLDMQQYIHPEYALRPTDPDSTMFTEFSASCIGFYLTVPVDDGMDIDSICADLRLIRTDGSILTEKEMSDIGYSSRYEYNTDDETTPENETSTEIHITGNWGGGPTIHIIDLDAYSGIQINGTNYYFINKNTTVTATQTQNAD